MLGLSCLLKELATQIPGVPVVAPNLDLCSATPPIPAAKTNGRETKALQLMHVFGANLESLPAPPGPWDLTG